MRTERNGEESTKKGRNGDAETERYIREMAVEFNREKGKKWESNEERDRMYVCVYVCVCMRVEMEQNVDGKGRCWKRTN